MVHNSSPKSLNISYESEQVMNQKVNSDFGLHLNEDRNKNFKKFKLPDTPGLDQ